MGLDTRIKEGESEREVRVHMYILCHTSVALRCRSILERPRSFGLSRSGEGQIPSEAERK